MVKVLMEKGANTVARERPGCTVLHQMARYGTAKRILLLLENEVIIINKNSSQKRALHLQQRMGTLSQSIARQRVNIGAQDEHGWTAPHEVVMWLHQTLEITTNQGPSVDAGRSKIRQRVAHTT